jgi:polyisoprenoid-binding protein YceI
MSRTAGTSSPLFAPQGLWVVDPERSTVRFRVKHLLVAGVEGSFGAVAGTVSVDGRDVRAEGSVQVATIDTGMPERDERLRGGGFFDVRRHPKISFQATRAKHGDRGGWSVSGDMTIMGNTAPFTFSAYVEDGARGPRITARGAHSRRKHGLDWSGLLHSGRAVVGDRVDIELVLELR